MLLSASKSCSLIVEHIDFIKCSLIVEQFPYSGTHTCSLIVEHTHLFPYKGTPYLHDYMCSLIREHFLPIYSCVYCDGKMEHLCTLKLLTTMGCRMVHMVKERVR